MTYNVIYRLIWLFLSRFILSSWKLGRCQNWLEGNFGTKMCVVCCFHNIMSWYLLMSKHRMSNDGMPFQKYNNTNWLLGRKGPGPKIMLSIFPSSRQSWYIFVCLLGQNTDGSLLSTIIMSCTMHMYWYLACIKWKVTYWFVSEEAKAVLLLSVYDNAQIESDFMPLVVVLMMMIWWQISALQF